MNFLLKSDQFRKARGGRARIVRITCAKCQKSLFTYQKDGPGPMKRIYFDRIIKSTLSLKGRKTSLVNCPSCGVEIGIPYIYKSENRRALRLFAFAVESAVVGKKSAG